jgi:hypothetical protein
MVESAATLLPVLMTLNISICLAGVAGVLSEMGFWSQWAFNNSSLCSACAGMLGERGFYAFYAFYAWWFYFPWSRALGWDWLFIFLQDALLT